MRRTNTICGFLLLILLWGTGWMQAEPPRLVVVIVIDQFRPDYLTRFRKYFLPAREHDKLGGFNYLLQEGAVYWDAQYSHLPTFTCVGHSTILTGAAPADSGIIGNSWYDVGTRSWVSCVDDKAPGAVAPRSPRTMQVSTVGDELKLSNNGKSKVLAIGYKDYAVISLGGRDSSLGLWFDRRDGQWVSNAYYLKSQQLPGWVREFNQSGQADAYRSQVWDRLLPPDAYIATRQKNVLADEKEAGYGYGWTFPHQPEGGRYSFQALVATPLANDLLADVALAAVAGEELGEDEYPDILALTLSSNDYIGHLFGPSSPEVLDTTVRTDRTLSRFFNRLQAELGLQGIVFVLTSDHGVQYIPREITQNRGSAGRLQRKELQQAAQAALQSRFGEGEWILAIGDLDLYLNQDLIEAKQLEAGDVQRVAANALTGVSGIATAFAAEDIRLGALPDTEMAGRAARTYFPGRSGDVILIPRPDWFMDENVSTTHGPPYSYNTHVPLILAGDGVRKGEHFRRADIRDIAPTLSLLLGIGCPSGSTGKLLYEALGGP